MPTSLRLSCGGWIKNKCAGHVDSARIYKYRMAMSYVSYHAYIIEVIH